VTEAKHSCHPKEQDVTRILLILVTHFIVWAKATSSGDYLIRLLSVNLG